MPYEPDQFLLRRYHVARNAGDPDAAREAWKQLTLNNFDRIKQIVKTFRFSAGSRGLPDFEWGSAASEAYLRVIAMGANFHEREIGQFRAALVTCVENTCRDYGRKEFRHDTRTQGSFDKKFEPDGETGPFDAALAAYDAARRLETREAIESELSRQHDEQLVAWAIARVGNANYREVLELTYIAKLQADDIAEQLSISMANLYQRRHRGISELEKILRDFKS